MTTIYAMRAAGTEFIRHITSPGLPRGRDIRGNGLSWYLERLNGRTGPRAPWDWPYTRCATVMNGVDAKNMRVS